MSIRGAWGRVEGAVSKTTVLDSGGAARLVAAFCVVLTGSVFVSGCTTSAVATKPTSTVRGMVTAPVEGAYLFIYEKGADPHGPPLVQSMATGTDGVFELDLADGEYTVVARKHMNGLPGSPLSEGDQKSGPVDVVVRGGRMEMPALQLMAKSDDVKYFDASEKSDTSVSGIVMDSDGKPKAGLRVHVYTYAQMSERPKYVSGATGPDGRYVVYLPKGGTYYLAARDHFGGPPKIGDFYGRYDEGTIDPSGVILRTGQDMEGVNITVHKVW